MSLSKIDKEHRNSLLATMNNVNIDHNVLEVVKSNHVHYGRLKQISKQMELLQKEAEEIVIESYEQNKLQNIKCGFKKKSGETYYLYENEKTNEFYFSLISPKEWGNRLTDKHVGSYYYDYDKTFTHLSE